MKIKVNGKFLETQHLSLHDLRSSLYEGTDNLVTILNGFQTPDDAQLTEDSEVVFIEKGKMPPQDQLEEMMVARHTPGVHAKVKKARVAVAGLGGLGSAIALSLARTGVGYLFLVDFDIVEPSNLNRQQYKIKHLGMHKTDALKQEISEINPYIEVETDCVRVTEDNVVDLFHNVDIVCEAFDNPAAKAMLVNTLLTSDLSCPIVSGSGMAGYESSNTIQTRRITDRLYLCGDGETSAKVGRGLMAPRVSICAGHEANMILRLILGEKEV